MIATYRDEQTNNPILDRIQARIREVIDALNVLDALPLPRYVLALQKDFTTTSATAQRTPLAFPVRKGETWLVEFAGLAGCTGSANGMKFAILAPAGSEISGALDSSLTTATDDSHQQFTAVNTLTTAVHTVNGGVRDDAATFCLKASENGFCAIAIAATTSGNTAKLAAKAWIRASRYREV